ncbi:c-type cytochrome [Psychrobacter sp. I-STPA10]|uniref:c-type cytochrome n=1 Tax=Psychrobacter sp. I-STPA10 TaxID=2585769 RepID=UPI001E35A675|nr:cytochrome c [Psychrobacter sp. I-STPA10]
MNIKSALFASIILPIGLLITACSSTSDNTGVKERQDMMANWGDAMKVMGGMMKNPDTFDAAKFQEEAAFLATDAVKPWTHFADENSKGGATDAVWTDAAGFKAEADKFQQATAELNTAAQNATSTADVQAAFENVSASCKSCHTTYKQPN